MFVGAYLRHSRIRFRCRFSGRKADGCEIRRDSEKIENKMADEIGRKIREWMRDFQKIPADFPEDGDKEGITSAAMAPRKHPESGNQEVLLTGGPLPGGQGFRRRFGRDSSAGLGRARGVAEAMWKGLLRQRVLSQGGRSRRRAVQGALVIWVVGEGGVRVWERTERVIVLRVLRRHVIHLYVRLGFRRK